MIVKGEVYPNTYRDSIALMQVASALSQRDGIARVEVLMATESNLDALRYAGLFSPEMAGARASDIVVAIEAETADLARECLDSFRETLSAASAVKASGHDIAFSIEGALEQRPDANLVLLSIPGQFVRREAERALDRGLNLFIFSDNVPVEDEIYLKRIAESRELLVMGPDCGTAIVGGIALGFANRVRRGSVGIVAASGTGLQEVACLIDRAGLGISHALGTGSNDVKSAVGGISLLRGLRMLEADPSTEIIVIITKPPEKEVAERVLAEVKKCTKRVIVNFLGADAAAIAGAGAIPAATLEAAARLAVEEGGAVFSPDEGDGGRLAGEAGKLADGQRYVRGVFSGGTLAAEAALILSERLGDVFSNTGLGRTKRLDDARASRGHTCVDLGDDEFTRGKPHPMLEPVMRDHRILQEAEDPGTAVLLLDVVLGLGVHPNPGGAVADTLSTMRLRAALAGRYLPAVVSVCGTEADPQRRSSQIARLREAGALVFGSNAEAARAAADIALGASRREQSDE